MHAPSSIAAIRFRLLPGCWLGVALVAVTQGADWPNFLGPTHDGVSTETIRTNWAAAPPEEVWQVSLEPGLSSVAVQRGRVFTQARGPAEARDQEFCLALDAETGAELWASPLGLADYPHGGVGLDDGPRSTPSTDGERVFVLTSYLRLVGLWADTGEEIWSRDLRSEFGSEIITWQNAASPVIEDGLVIVNGNAPNGSLLAVRAEYVTTVWQDHDDRMTHATPVVAEIGGVRQVVFFAQSGLVSVMPQTGAVLWRHPLNYNMISVAASPVVAGDHVYCSRAYPGSLSAAQAGATVVQVTPSVEGMSASTVWYRTNQFLNHWNTPVHHQGHLYGMYGQSVLTFKCIELDTGVEKWSVSGFGYGSVLVVGQRLLALTDNGELVLVDPNPETYTEIARHRALTGKCWNIPAVSGGRIYVRSTTGLVSLDVASATPPLPALRLMTARLGEGVFRVAVRNDDGSPIDPDRAGRITVLTRPSLESGAGVWTPFGGELIQTNGELQFEVTGSAAQAERYFRVVEQPR